MIETRNNIRQDWLSVPRRREEERLDPHVYKRGINGLTVEEALRRAFPRVIDILSRSGEEYSEFERQLVKQTVRACLISQVSRANLYRIAGILVADRRDEGAHIDTSLALAYVAALREAFITELSVGERVQTPLGFGEVRYVSGDGANAAIRLDNDYEVWLPAGTGNDLAATVCIPEDPDLAKDVILQNRGRWLDVARVRSEGIDEKFFI